MFVQFSTKKIPSNPDWAGISAILCLQKNANPVNRHAHQFSARSETQGLPVVLSDGFTLLAYSTSMLPASIPLIAEFSFVQTGEYS